VPAADRPATGRGPYRGRVSVDREDRTEEIVEHLFALVDRLRFGFEAAVARFELSPPQAKALHYLVHAGPVPMRELASSLGCDASNVTGIVDRLERRGYVERRPDERDRRVRTLVLTSTGLAVTEAMWIHVCAGATALVELGDNEQAILLALLRRLDRPALGRCAAPGDLSRGDRSPGGMTPGARSPGGSVTGAGD